MFAFFALAGLSVPNYGQDMALQTIADVQALSADEARSGQNVHLRGVVTFSWRTATTEFVIQDRTGAIWCPAITLPFDCRFGTEIEVEGRTDFGGFGAFVHALVVRPIGRGNPPSPLRSTFEELLSSQINGRWVEFVGVIRGQRMNPELGLDWLALEVATGGGRITVNVTHETVGHPELIDATVFVRGVCLHATDPQQQAFLPMIYAHSLSDIEVLAPANAEPFDQPVTPLSAIMRSTSVSGTGHRIRSHGVVTYVGTSNSFYLQDESRGTQVFLREAPGPIQGEAIDVVGFPEPGAFSPVLRDADWRPTGAKTAPPAQSVRIAGATKYDGRLIAIEGRLTEISASDRQTVLTLEDENLQCRVHVSSQISEKLEVGSILRVTGVCSVEIGDWESFVALRKPIGFSLLVQDAQGIVLVRAAPWLNLARAAWLVLIIAVTLSGVFGVISLRSRSRLREAAHTRDAAQAQFSAVLTERTRIAREIHDTLAQGLTGISAHLEVLNDRMDPAPEPLRRHLLIARELVQNSLEEARRSVWNLRSYALEESGVGGALARLGQQLVEGTSVTFEMEVNGTPRKLPPDIENNLLRVGQEAVTNAVRHANASSIFLYLSFLAGRVQLAIVDNGIGFDECEVRPSLEGGYGLSGIRERAAAMHASCSIRQESAGGTRLELTVPHV